MVILTLDGAALIGRLLESFGTVNTYPNAEFIVVDHGSSDGTIELLRGRAAHMPIKILPRGANYSFSASNNWAVQHCSSELVLFLNNDVTFIDDVLGDMVGVIADPGVGLVGLKQYQPADNPSGRRLYHVGVRFGWSLAERRLRPYHVKAKGADAHLANERAVFPAVTASILMCRRDDFLAVGGFSEAYDYGLEDVDLCCKVRWRLGKSIVCVNDRSALHAKNTTRDRNPEARRAKEAANRRTLQHRCGYALRREFLTRRLVDDGSFTGRRFTAAIALDAEDGAEVAGAFPRAWSLGEALRQDCGWDVRFLARPQWTHAAGLDLYIVASGDVDLGALVDAEPHLMTEVWNPDERGEPRGGWTERASELQQLMAHRIDRLRIALKVTDSADAESAGALHQGLQASGALVRIDLPADWYCPSSLADDVAIALKGAADYEPAPDQINIFLSGSVETPDAAQVALQIISRQHAERVLGPADTALPEAVVAIAPPPRAAE